MHDEIVLLSIFDQFKSEGDCALADSNVTRYELPNGFVVSVIRWNEPRRIREIAVMSGNAIDGMSVDRGFPGTDRGIWNLRKNQSLSDILALVMNTNYVGGNHAATTY